MLLNNIYELSAFKEHVALFCTPPLPHDFIYMYVQIFYVVRIKTGHNRWPKILPILVVVYFIYKRQTELAARIAGHSTN